MSSQVGTEIGKESVHQPSNASNNIIVDDQPTLTSIPRNDNTIPIKSLEPQIKFRIKVQGNSPSDLKTTNCFKKRHPNDLKDHFYHLIYTMKMRPSKASDIVGVPQRTGYNWFKKLPEELYKTFLVSKTGKGNKKIPSITAQEDELRNARKIASNKSKSIKQEKNIVLEDSKMPVSQNNTKSIEDLHCYIDTNSMMPCENPAELGIPLLSGENTTADSTIKGSISLPKTCDVNQLNADTPNQSSLNLSTEKIIVPYKDAEESKSPQENTNSSSIYPTKENCNLTSSSKKERGYYRKYSNKLKQQFFDLILKKNMVLKDAAKKLGLPPQTGYYWLKSSTITSIDNLSLNLKPEVSKPVSCPETVKNTVQSSNDFPSVPNSIKDRRKKHSDDLKEKFYRLVYIDYFRPSRAADALGIPQRTAYHWSKNVSEEKYKSTIASRIGSSFSKKQSGAKKEKFFDLVQNNHMESSLAADALRIPRRTANRLLKKIESQSINT